ncbi:MAG: PrsW family intramembrane metalloprotease [Lachnospiraceae bacterium]|nr:PrsW family intramembrane metalloprotease [Lachnospiraceae bacterium]
MFYFLVMPVLTWHVILIVAAVIPAVFLMIKVYQSDRLEKESPYLLWDLMKVGIFSSLVALVSERILSFILDLIVPVDSGIYDVILYFIVVACSEEGAKYFFLKRETWKGNPEFNCQYDGVVYATFVSLGFALWENISYVLSYGFATAVVRAVTAIPGHACFGVFMGVFYGIAKKYERANDTGNSQIFRVAAVIVPVLLHGAYDYIASQEDLGSALFIVFVVVLFGVSYYLVGKTSQNDKYI